MDTDSKKDKTVKFHTYKKLNEEASIYGFPFTVFFVVIVWTILSFFIILSAPIFIKILMIVVAIIGLFGIYYVYNKIGLKKALKLYDLFFKNIDIIRINEPIRIEKLKIKTQNE